VSKKYCYFSTYSDKNSVFLELKFLQKGKLLGDRIFYPQRPNFSSGLAEKFCKELATLVPVQAGDGALDAQQHHRNTADQHKTAHVKIFRDFWSKQLAHTNSIRFLNVEKPIVNSRDLTHLHENSFALGFREE
jgi:hypothetical protein